jgi:hypothetical protein
MKGVATLLLICLNQSTLFAQVDSARWYFAVSNSVPHLKEGRPTYHLCLPASRDGVSTPRTFDSKYLFH